MQWRIGARVLQSLGQVGSCCEDKVSGTGGWHGDMAGEPFDCVADAGGPGADAPYFIASVGVHGWTDVPCFDCMGVPSFSLVRFLVAEDEGSWRG